MRTNEEIIELIKEKLDSSLFETQLKIQQDMSAKLDVIIELLRK